MISNLVLNSKKRISLKIPTPFFVPPSHIRDKTRDHLPGFPIRVVVEDDLQLVGGARVVHQAGDKLLHLGRG